MTTEHGPTDREADYVIVGAGLAGLQAARALRDAGSSVVVLEARDRVGGRTLAGVDSTSPDPSLVFDMGGQWIGPGQVEVHRLAREVDLHPVPTAVPGRTLWDLGNGARRGSPRVPPLPPGALASVLLAVTRLNRMSHRLPLATPWDAREATGWDGVTFEDWLRAHVGTRGGRALLRLYVNGHPGLEAGEMSVLDVLFMLRSAGSLQHLLHAQDFRLLEGAHELARRSARCLGDAVVLEAPVDAIAQDAGGVTVSSGSTSVRCRRVGVCAPVRVAAEIAYSPPLPADRMALMRHRPTGVLMKFYAAYPSPFWRRRGLNGQAFSTSHTIAATGDNSPADGSGRGVLVGLTGADRARALSALPEAERRSRILSSLADLFGAEAAEPETLVVEDWSKERWTSGLTGGGDASPRTWTTVGHAYRTPSGRVHWGGTETSPEWHGYMEGALRSGLRMAGEMLAAEGAPEGGGAARPVRDRLTREPHGESPPAL
ncbi:MAG: FAD-dependent oxidoreductase [Candidatus Dormibacteria bacterium]|jgi:monoamine oxidase